MRRLDQRVAAEPQLQHRRGPERAPATKNRKYDADRAGRKFLTGTRSTKARATSPITATTAASLRRRRAPRHVEPLIALRGLKAAATDPQGSRLDKAMVFVSRSQNRSESNDQPFAANDGGFVYMPGWNRRVRERTGSYGGMSAAGLISLLSPVWTQERPARGRPPTSG